CPRAAVGRRFVIGLGALSSIISGWGNVREMAPLVAGVAFASQAGCRMTAEIGSMRIADEIDATEAMGLRSIPFVVGTRLVGGLMCVIPGFLLTLVVSFLTCDIVIR
ncbi:ABC transporter permease, partial [Mycobacteroides abscessus]|uniref:ABC transporter permease n=1 Tax=Mycobacteroides abscessus TaxID=36809 RepID=UPI003CF397BB